MKKSLLPLLLIAAFFLIGFSTANAAQGKIVLPYTEMKMSPGSNEGFVQAYANLTNRSKFTLQYYVKAIDKNGKEVARYPEEGTLPLPGSGGVVLNWNDLFSDLSSNRVCVSYHIEWSSNAWRIVTPFCTGVIELYNADYELIDILSLNFYDNSIFY